MKIKIYLPSLLVVGCLCLCTFTNLSAQLHFEGLVYNGQNGALLEAPTATALSPDNHFLYLVSASDDAVSIFYKTASGELNFVATQKNETEGVFGIGGAQDLLVSPDGKHLYVAGKDDHAIGIFARESATGHLQYLAQVKNGEANVEALVEPQSLAMSADGNYLYVTSPSEDALLVFRRNVLSGSLEFIEKKQDGLNAIDGLSGAMEVQLSPDDRHLYVTAKADGAICLFERNITNGKLNFITAFQEASIPGGLSDAYGLELSKDGTQVFATSAEQGSLFAFARDSSTGWLTYQDIAFEDQAGLAGLAYAVDIVLSADGQFVYAIGAEANALLSFRWNAMMASFEFLSVINDENLPFGELLNPTSIQLSLTGNRLYLTAEGSHNLLVFKRDIQTGTLTLMTTIDNEATGWQGLNDPQAANLSPDGQHLYAAGYEANSLVVFERNLTNGQLSFIQSLSNGNENITDLVKPKDIIVSPDGHHVYVASNGADAIVVFTRNVSTGNLSYQQTIDQNLAGVSGLNGVTALALSPDGNTLYAAGYWDNALVAFTRNPITGSLQFLAKYQDGIAGVDGLALLKDVIVSADGQQVYTISFWDDAISVFQRDTNTGSLAFQQILKDGFAGVDGLDGGEAIQLSADGAQLYSISFFDQAIAQFDRDPMTGNLSFTKVYKNGMPGLVGLTGLRSIAVSPNDAIVYICNTGDDGVTAYHRSATTGELSLAVQQRDGIAGVNGVATPSNIMLSPDGASIYVCGSGEDAIAHFSCGYTLALEETICAGESFSYADQTYTALGFYRDTLVEGNCRTFVSLALEVLPIEFEVAATICTGDSYALGNDVYTESGQYIAILTSTAGCDSIVHLSLTVADALEEDLVISLCGGDSITVGTTSYSETGTYTQTLVNDLGCDSTVQLNLTVLSPILTSLEATICANEFFVMGTQHYTHTGNYQAHLTAANGCDSIVELALTVLPTSTGNLSATICENEAYQIGNESFTTAGVYWVRLTNAKGCDSLITLDLTILPAPEMVTEATICEGMTYWWKGQAYTETGIYEENYDAGNGCTGKEKLKLTVQPDYSEETISLCEGESYAFAGVTLTEAGVYSNLFNSTQGCDSLVVLYCTVIPAVIETSVTICGGEEYALGATSYQETGNYVQTITTEEGCSQTVNLNLTVREHVHTAIDTSICAGAYFQVGEEVYTLTGNYQDTLLTSVGCDSVVSLNLTVQTALNIEETISLDKGNQDGKIELLVTGGIAPYTFVWSTGSTNQDLINLSTGNYSVTLTDAANCTLIQNFVVDNLVSLAVEKETIALQLYPNPVAKATTIRLAFVRNTETPIRMQVFNALGQELEEFARVIPQGTAHWDMHLPSRAGTYLIRLQDQKAKRATRRIIVY